MTMFISSKQYSIHYHHHLLNVHSVPEIASNVYNGSVRGLMTIFVLCTRKRGFVKVWLAQGYIARK